VCLFIRNLSVAVSGQLFYFGVLFAAYFTFEFVCFLFNFIEMINDLKLKYKFESSIVICVVERSFFYEHLIWGELGEIYYPTLESQIHFFPLSSSDYFQNLFNILFLADSNESATRCFLENFFF
jgi:hypothetical protein